MNDEDHDPRDETLLQDFGQLAPEDQDLVIALVNRLRGPLDADDAVVEPGYTDRVSFMDFDD